MTNFRHIKFAADMKKAMKKHGLSSYDVAILSDVSQATVSRLARAEEENPHLQIWLKICHALELEANTYIS